MKSIQLTLVIGCLAAICACQHAPAHRDIPATRTSPTHESQQELHQAVSEMLGGQQILLSDSALTSTSLLIVEIQPRQRIDTGGDLGRNREKPEHFQLFLNNSQCLLERRQSGQRKILQLANCQPE